MRDLLCISHLFMRWLLYISLKFMMVFPTYKYLCHVEILVIHGKWWVIFTRKGGVCKKFHSLSNSMNKLTVVDETGMCQLYSNGTLVPPSHKRHFSIMRLDLIPLCFPAEIVLGNNNNNSTTDAKQNKTKKRISTL